MAGTDDLRRLAETQRREGAGRPEASSIQDSRAAEGRAFGRYRLLGELGRGGMGVVWKAWDTQLNRTVALKQILGEGFAPDLIERFMTEARAAARLRHPNIVAIHDVGVEEGQHYFTMEFIEGAPLSERKPSVREALTIARDVARALHAAHEQGVVHRDIKPANILIDGAGKPYVTDFGLARDVNVSGLTMSGDLLGTPGYMSPEQAAGRTKEVGPASDQFSLGVTLYTVLAGENPFSGEGVHETLTAIIQKEPPPLPAVHRDIETICLKALEKDRARRYPSLKEFADDIDRALEGEPIRARAVSLVYRVRKGLAKRRPIVAAGAVAVIVTAAILIPQWFRAEKAKRRAEANERVMRRLADASELQFDGGATAARIHAAASGVVADATAALAEFPEEARLYLYRGRARRLLGEDTEAEADFLQAVARDPDEGSAHYELGWMDLERLIDLNLSPWGDALSPEELTEAKDRVTARFRRAIATGRAAESENQLAKLAALYLAGEEILADCNAVIEKGGRVDAYYHLRGIAATDERVALKDFDRAVDRAPNNPRYRFERAGARQKGGDFNGAIEDLTRVIELRPTSVAAYLNRGSAKGLGGDWEAAIEDSSRAIAISKGNPLAYYNRGHEKTQTGDFRGGIEDYTRAIALKRDYVDAYVNRAVAKGKLGDLDGAIEDCDRAIAIRKNARAYFNRGVSKGKQGDRQGEIDDCTVAIECDGRCADAYIGRGSAKSALGDHAGAIADLTSGLKIDGSSVEAYVNRGYSAVQLAREDATRRRTLLEGAASDYRSALQCARSDWPFRPKAEAALKAIERELTGTEF